MKTVLKRSRHVAAYVFMAVMKPTTFISEGPQRYK